MWMFKAVFFVFAFLPTSSSAAGRGRHADYVVDCRGTLYTHAEVNKCQQAACANLRRGTHAGHYPDGFRNHPEHFTFTGVGGRTLFEFPLVGGHNAYRGGHPGADRCIVAYGRGNMGCDVVGKVTHTGVRRKNRFVLCDDV